MRWELLVTLGALWACGGNARENAASGGASSASHAGAAGDPSVSSSTAGGATSAGGTDAGGTATSTAPQGAAGTSSSSSRWLCTRSTSERHEGLTAYKVRVLKEALATATGKKRIDFHRRAAAPPGAEG